MDYNATASASTNYYNFCSYRMNAYEYFIKQKWKCALNIAHAQERNAKAEEIENLERKMGYFDEAVEALKKMEEMRDDLR